MKLDEIYGHFCDESPLTAMARITLEHAFEDELLDKLFRDHAEKREAKGEAKGAKGDTHTLAWPAGGSFRNLLTSEPLGRSSGPGAVLAAGLQRPGSADRFGATYPFPVSLESVQ